jgi:hypothetical protein
MTEPKNSDYGADALAEAVRRMAKLNALSDRDSRICDVLTRMIGREVVPGRGAQSSIFDFLSGPPVAPSFHEFPQFESYRQATDALEKARRIENMCEKLLSEMNSDVDIIDSFSHDQTIRDLVAAHRGPMLVSMAAIYGIGESTAVCVALLKLGMRLEAERIERAKQSLFKKAHGRPTNMKAAYIADTLAKFYLQHVKERPTYGSNEGYPSTPFCRALQELFELFDVGLGFIGPAKKAAKAITDVDVRRANPGLNALASFSNTDEI